MGVATTVEVPPTRGVVRAVHQHFADHDRVRCTVGDRRKTNVHAVTTEDTVHTIHVRRITMIGPTARHAVNIDRRKRVARSVTGSG